MNKKLRNAPWVERMLIIKIKTQIQTNSRSQREDVHLWEDPIKRKTPT